MTVRVALLIAVVCVLSACGGSSNRGPLAAREGPASSRIAAKIGTVYSTGLVELNNRSGATITLERVAIMGGTGGMKVAGVGVERNPGSSVGLGKGFPPDGTPGLEKLEGFVIHPHERHVFVVVGASATRAGVNSFHSIAVTYRTNLGVRYTNTFAIGLEISAR